VSTLETRCDAMRCDAMRCDAMRCDAMPLLTERMNAYNSTILESVPSELGTVPVSRFSDMSMTRSSDN